MMPKWLFAALLVIQAHFAASFLVPLDAEAQKTFGGLLRWAWPWSEGDSGPLGEVTSTQGVPFVGLILAIAAGSLLILAALAVMGWWVPFDWWRVLVIGGAVLSLLLMIVFPGITKVLPALLAIALLWMTLFGQYTVSWSDPLNVR